MDCTIRTLYHTQSEETHSINQLWFINKNLPGNTCNAVHLGCIKILTQVVGCVNADDRDAEDLKDELR